MLNSELDEHFDLDEPYSEVGMVELSDLFPDVNDDCYVRAGITDSISELLLYAQSEEPKLRQGVAANPNLPIFLATVLAPDPSVDVRITLSENESTSYLTLLALSKDESADVRYAIAENGNTPLAIICELTMDENPFVSSRANETIKRLSLKRKHVSRMRRNLRRAEDYLFNILEPGGWAASISA
jgi:hypothetical protein